MPYLPRAPGRARPGAGGGGKDTVMHGLAMFLAAPTPAPFNIDAMTKLVGSFIGILILAAGAGILIKVHQQRNVAGAVSSGAILLLGLIVVGLALTGKFDSVASGLANVVFG
jgi:hypothetical protein